MEEAVPNATDTTEQRAERYRYWRSRSPAERWNETWRLSVEEYGVPEGSLRDGPFRLIRLNPDGSEEVVREWSGPNPPRHK